MPGYGAEYIVVDEGGVVLKPDFLSFEEACTIPIAVLSAWNGLNFLGLSPGDDILLYGSGGVSTYAIQFAKARGLRPFVVVTNENGLSKMKDLGAYQVFNSKTDQGWHFKIMAYTDMQELYSSSKRA